MSKRTRSSRPPPSARRLVIGLMTFGAVFALVVVVVVGVVLVEVRSDAERDVDAMLFNSVQTQLTDSAAQQADVVERELQSARQTAGYLASATVDAYEHPVTASAAEIARYREGPNGSYLTTEVDGGSAMIYTGFHPVGAVERAKAAQLAALDPTLKSVVNSSPLVVQAYINTWDSMNRTYPGFDVLAKYPPKTDISSYSSYSLADQVHDPSRDPVLTDVSIDPGGRGWMTSAVSPVYVAGRLEAVVGVDVTVSRLIGTLLSKPQPFGSYSVLVDSDGVITAMSPPAEGLFGLKKFASSDYATYVTQDTFQPEQFNIRHRLDTQNLSLLLDSSSAGGGKVTIGDTSVLVAWHRLEAGMGWRIVTIVPESSVRALHAPGERVKSAATATLWIVAFAFVALTATLTYRARRQTLAFTRPLEAIDHATARIAAGDFEPTLPPAPIAELQRTGEQLLAMGRSLQGAQNQMLTDANRLREGEQRYRAIFENVAEPVLTVSADGTVIDANDQANDTFGRHLPGGDVSEVLGSTAWRSPGRRSFDAAGPDGISRSFELAVSRTGTGDHTRYTLTVHDVTAATEARRLLEGARATAEHTARLKDEFLASMSHEIRTPLNGVIGVLSLLADRDLPPEASKELSVARSSADDLLVLVNDVLDFAKIEAGQVSVVTNDVRLHEVLDGVRQLYEPFAGEQFNEVLLDVDPTLPEWVRIDPTRVRQVLVNLVSNALKFTDHGTVTMVVRPETPLVRGDRSFVLRFEIVDTGVGIDPDVQARLFTRFSQGDPLSIRKFPGTGLGLAITKRLAELMGGEVGLVSSLGQGSTFWFTVPSAAGEPATTSATVAAAAGDDDGSALRVLVAEDNDVNRYLIVSILERLGHSVLAVANGQEAVGAARGELFDAVLMDVQMPVTNGIDATKEIRALPGRAGQVPIFAVTANVLPDQQTLYRQAGFTGWVPKPLTLEQVRVALASVAPATDRPLFDHDLIEHYRSVLGADRAQEMVTLFLRTLEERRVELEAGVAAHDLSEIRRVGHALKGLAAAIGARRLSATGSCLEHAELAEVPVLVDRLDRESVWAIEGVAAAWRLHSVG